MLTDFLNERRKRKLLGVQGHAPQVNVLDFNSLKSPFSGFRITQIGYWPVPRGYRSLVYRGVNKAFISVLIRRYSVQYSGTFLVSISLFVFLSIFRNWGEATLKLQSS